MRRIEEQTAALAKELGVVGLMNVQYAVQQSDHGGAASTSWRSTRGAAGRCPSSARPPACRWPGWPPGSSPGRSCATSTFPGGRSPSPPAGCRAGATSEHVAVKEAVLPFPRFPGVDTTLGPGDEVHR